MDYFLSAFPCLRGILTLEWPFVAFGSSGHSFINQKCYTDIIAMCHIKLGIVKNFHFPNLKKNLLYGFIHFLSCLSSFSYLILISPLLF